MFLLKIFLNRHMKDGNMLKYHVKLDKEYVENGFDIFKYVGRDYGFTPIRIKDCIVPSLQYAIDNAKLVFLPGSARIVTDVSKHIPDVWPEDSFITISFNEKEKLKNFMKLFLDEN